ncbi:hypothetical protein [Nesterenkonia halophila]|nr:hypothetical protein [Nesterenkonia halophila]
MSASRLAASLLVPMTVFQAGLAAGAPATAAGTAAIAPTRA